MRDRVVVEGVVARGMAQDLGDARVADLVGELEDLAHVTPLLLSRPCRRTHHERTLAHPTTARVPSLSAQGGPFV
jgi:hypothetical protein